MHPSANEDSTPTMIALLTQIRDELARLDRRVAALAESVGRIEKGSPAHPSPLDAEPIQPRSEGELRGRLRQALDQGDPYGVLDHRLPLALCLEPATLAELDRELAVWFSKYFQSALRSGQALVIAGAMERAVTELTPLPEIEPLAEALPLVRRTIGVWEENLRRQDEEDWD